MRVGDANTKYFHATTKERKTFNRIEEINKEDGSVINNKAEIEEAVVGYSSKNIGDRKGK